MGILANFTTALREFRSAGRPDSVSVPDSRRLEQREELWLGAALLAATGVGMADALAGSEGVLLTGFFAIPVVLATATTGWRSTSVVALYTLMLAMLSGLWNEMLSTNEFVIRVLITTVVGGIGTWGAVRRGHITAAARGGAALVESLALPESTGLETTMEQAQEQTRLAAILQQSLLPPLVPRIDELEIATRFRPAGAGEIGGDFYDLLRLGESSWAIVIGDVCGKGPEAAALTLSMRDTLRASKIRGESPKETLTLLNEAIRDAHVDRRFCTSAYARFDLDSEPIRLTVCNGGHPLPLLMRAGGGIEPIGRNGTLLGVYEDPDLTDLAFEIDHGDAVLLYTDGLVEVRPNRGPPIDARTLLEGCSGKSAEEIAAIVEERSLAAHGGQLEDDMAVIVVRRA